MADPYYNDIFALLHCNGANDSDEFTDSGPTGILGIASFSGTPLIKTAQSRFGGASLGLTGGDTLGIDSFASSITPLAIQTGDFTLEFHVRLTTIDGDHILIVDGVGTTYSAKLWIENSTDKLRFTCRDSGGSIIIDLSSTATLSTGVWYHVAGVRDGSTFRLFLDGTQEATDTDASALYDTSGMGYVQIGGDGVGDGLKGYLDDIRITEGVARYTSGFTPPAAPFDDEYGPADPGGLTDPGPLGAPSMFAGHGTVGRIAVRGVLGTESFFGAAPVLGYASDFGLPRPPDVVGLHDFTPALSGILSSYVMDLTTPDGVIRVPISSWQATLQTDARNYTQCVVPACLPLVDALNDATEFKISRRAVLPGGQVLEYEMAKAPVEALQFYGGSDRYTCTVSGYSDAFTADSDPPATFDRTVTGVRSTSSSSGTSRARCDIDWLLRPGHRAFVSGSEMLVGWVNYYVNTRDAFMDIGERSAGG